MMIRTVMTMSLTSVIAITSDGRSLVNVDPACQQGVLPTGRISQDFTNPGVGQKKELCASLCELRASVVKVC